MNKMVSLTLRMDREDFAIRAREDRIADREENMDADDCSGCIYEDKCKSSPDRCPMLGDLMYEGRSLTWKR